MQLGEHKTHLSLLVRLGYLYENRVLYKVKIGKGPGEKELNGTAEAGYTGT